MSGRKFLIPQVLEKSALTPTGILANTPDGTVTLERFSREVLAMAARLLELGVLPGDRVAVCYPTEYQHTVLDFAILAAGAVAVPIYESDSQEQIEWILTDADPVLLITHPTHLARMRAAHTTISHRSSVLAGLDPVSGPDLESIRTSIESIQSSLVADSPAAIIYTSGTTGRSKGCTITHGNLAFAIEAARLALPELIGPTERTVLFLPLAHIFARVVQYACVCGSVTLSYSTPTTILEDLAKYRPTWLTVVPRVLEKVYAGAEANATGARRRIFAAAVNTALAHARAREADANAPASLSWKLYDRLVYRNLRARLGGSLRFVLSGGAPLDPRLDLFFTGAGITVLEGYGLTETTAAHTVSRPTTKRAGTVGSALDGCTVKVLDGELLLAGENVFAGYWNNDSATAASFHSDSEGRWFKSGDLGSIDPLGRVSITGRIKDLLITSGGKNIQPSGLEELIVQHPAFTQCVVVGDRRPYVAALLACSPAWLAALGLSDPDPNHPAIKTAATEALASANQSVSQAESIKKWALLPRELSVEGGELTATLKTKRPVVAERYHDLIESLYAE